MVPYHTVGTAPYHIKCQATCVTMALQLYSNKVLSWICNWYCRAQAKELNKVGELSESEEVHRLGPYGLYVVLRTENGGLDWDEKKEIQA